MTDQLLLTTGAPNHLGLVSNGVLLLTTSVFTLTYLGLEGGSGAFGATEGDVLVVSGAVEAAASLVSGLEGS
jgi:hypothetical protein